jgi:hypothetical protein
MSDSSGHWLEWHKRYDDSISSLSRRLALVQGHINSWLDENPRRPVQVVSTCAGQGRDLIGVLADRSDQERVSARLIEYEPANVEIAVQAAASAGLSHIEVVCADAGELKSYAGAIPADLVLMCGVFGNISDADIEATIAAIPVMCASEAIVIWTRGRREPDLTPRIRGWFSASGFIEQAFDAPEGVMFAVGVHQYAGPGVTDHELNKHLFSFVQRD